MICKNHDTKPDDMKSKKSKTAKKSEGKKMIEKAGLAIKHEFYLEASFILASLFERKLKKMLGQIENQPGSGFTLEQSVKRVKYILVSDKVPDLGSYVNVEMIDNIRTWKNQRNEILKDIPDVHVSQARLERLATDGIRLFKELSKSAKALKSADGLSTGKSESSG
jgi:hypothetical protein